MIRMADSVEPWEIPELFRSGNNGVMAYANGPRQWSPEQLADFPRLHHITVNPLSVLPDAWRCMSMDVENEDCEPADVPPWYEKRREQLGADAMTMPYCDRSTVLPICQEMEKAGLDPAALWWWIATLDNLSWTPEQLSVHLEASWGAEIAPARIACIQIYPMGSYDESRWFTDPRWQQVKVQ
jgi:hypothetical protein